MNIHEIITAWQDETLPNDIPALAAAQNKVDDYLLKAKTGLLASKNSIVMDMYSLEVYCYSVVSGSIQQLIDKAIPYPVIPVAP